MDKILIVCKSVTHAQKIMHIINQNGFFSSISRTPSDINMKTCSYSVSIYKKDFQRVLQLLGQRNIQNLDLYQYSNGLYLKLEEV
ncbi:MAG: DUF3343 domain-containing protein [Clostridia bacterium]